MAFLPPPNGRRCASVATLRRPVRKAPPLCPAFGRCPAPSRPAPVSGRFAPVRDEPVARGTKRVPRRRLRRLPLRRATASARTAVQPFGLQRLKSGAGFRPYGGARFRSARTATASPACARRSLCSRKGAPCALAGSGSLLSFLVRRALLLECCRGAGSWCVEVKQGENR